MNKEDKEMLRQLYVFGKPIQSEIGGVRFLTCEEYILNAQHLSVMNMNVLHIYHQFLKGVKKKDEEALAQVEELKKESLYNIVLKTEFIRNSYFIICNMVLDSDEAVLEVFKNEKSFNYYRALVLDMHIMVEDEVSPNPEIQRGIELSRKAKREKSEGQSLTDIITSIVAFTGHTFSDVSDMTIYQLYGTFYRLVAMKSYDTETLFATVSTEVKNITPWNKAIDLFEGDSSWIGRKEFNEGAGGLLR